MAPASKIIGKKQKVRNIIFDRKLISRQDLIALSGLNERSVVRYAEALKRQKMILEERDSSRRGRPGIRYRSNSEQIFFGGFTVTGEKVCIVAITINALPLAARSFLLSPELSVSEMVTMIFDVFDSMCATLPGQILCSVGIGGQGELWNRRRGLNAVLPEAARTRYGVQVETHDCDELMLYFTCEGSFLSGRTGGFFLGNEFRLIVIENGEFRDDFREYQRRLRHWKIAPDSPVKCYCGKRGCLDSVLTYSALVKRYYMRLGVPPEKVSVIANLNNIYLKARAGETAALEIVEENAELFGRLGAKIRADLKLDHIVLMHINDLIASRAVPAFQRCAGSGALPLRVATFTYPGTAYAPALLMRKRLIDYK